MPSITFLPDNITVTVPEGAPLLEAARLAGVFVETPCGGRGTCGKCAVRVASGAVDFRRSERILAGAGENEMGERARAGAAAPGKSVLICQTFVKDEPVTVELLGKSGEKGKFDLDADISRYMPEKMEPFLKYVALTVARPALLDGLSDLDRFARAFREAVKCADVRLPIGVLAELPEKLRESDGEIKVFYYIDCMDGGVARVVDVCSGRVAENSPLGLAVDIGTTTVALWLVDMYNGAILAFHTAYNSQIECGLDVISRINYAKKYRRELKDRVLDTINALTAKACQSACAKPEQIRCASLAGNTTMVHLLLGVVPEYIRLAPYTPAVFELPAYPARDIGLKICENAPVLFAPAVGSYVGGDITSGALCTSLARGQDQDDGGETVLFIDIGTNGELLLGNGEFIFGCACSAGPAFEGGGIKCGMRASAGAIERVAIDRATGKPEFSVIGGGKAAGICGSGIISLVAELFRSGLIDSAGKFADTTCENIVRNGRSAEYVLCEGVSVTEPDIDNFIRAKGAVFSACQTVLDSVGMAFSDVGRVVIAGGFGRFLNLEDARTVGLLPRLPDGKFEFLGNTSLTGAYLALISEERRATERAIARRITYVDLSSEAGYMDKYMAALFLPHTDMEMFE